MRPEERDPAYLWDTLSHARVALDITAAGTFEAYLHDRMRQLALERAMEIIGEAARRVSDSFRFAHPEIPWQRIIAHRNLLAHEYDEVHHELLWKTATRHVPELIAVLAPLVPPHPAASDE